MYKNVVVGFDAREMWLDVDSQWTQQQSDLRQVKNEILLRLDVVKPLSVDDIVWHSVFSEISDPRLWRTVARQSKYSASQWNDVFSESRKLSSPDNFTARGGRGGWVDLAAMQEYLQKVWGSVWKPCYLVAIVEVIRDEDGMEEENKDSKFISPKLVDSQWQLLGYDVADYFLITGLFDPIRDPSGAAKLRHDWKNYLNEYHLFTAPEKAFDYIAVANSRKPEHTPYFVYALYGIQEK